MTGRAAREAGQVSEVSEVSGTQATALRKILVAQASVTAHNGTSAANACQTAGPEKVPAASTRDASTR